MARGVRFTKDEREVLKMLLDPTHMGLDHWGSRLRKAADSALAKLRVAEESQPGVAIGPIEEALVAAARGKVLPMEGGFGRASVVAAACGATPETATLIGAWMARQGWLNQPQTLLDVLNKWHQWLPKARATEPPPALTPGLGTHAPDGRGPAPAGPANPKRRSSPGFR